MEKLGQFFPDHQLTLFLQISLLIPSMFLDAVFVYQMLLLLMRRFFVMMLVAKKEQKYNFCNDNYREKGLVHSSSLSSSIRSMKDFLNLRDNSYMQGYIYIDIFYHDKNEWVLV